MDFYADWVVFLKESLEKAGYPVKLEDRDSICHVYFNAAMRRVPALSRKILTAREFTCPEEHLQGLLYLEEKVRIGLDLTPHMSRKILRLDYDDHILNDWGIHHFHLGLSYDDKGLIRGTPFILLARVTDSHFYMIDVVGHNLWNKCRYVEILHSNWPRSIEIWKCEGSEGLDHPPDDEAVRILRSGDINYPVQTEDGTCYMPMGGGITTSGVSINAVRKCLKARKLLEYFEKAVREEGTSILQNQLEGGTIAHNSCSFRLELRRDGAYAVGQRMEVQFFFGDRRTCSHLYGDPSLPLRLEGGV